MKSLFAIALLFITLSVQAGNPGTAEPVKITIHTQPAFQVQTSAETCPGSANGLVRAFSTSVNWSLTIYRNDELLNTVSVAGDDTIITNLSIGCYRFIYQAENGYKDTVSKIITSPSAVVSNFTVSYPQRAADYNADFMNKSSGAYSFDWDFGDGEHSAEISPEHIYSAPGTYTVTLTSTNIYGCSSSSSYTITVNGDQRMGNTMEAPATSASSQNPQ
jgi:PKD repeat protein